MRPYVLPQRIQAALRLVERDGASAQLFKDRATLSLRVNCAASGRLGRRSASSAAEARSECVALIIMLDAHALSAARA